MANSLAQYAKDLWETLFNSKENEEKYSADRKELEDFLHTAEETATVPSPKLPDSDGYDRIVYEGLTDDEIAKRAESELSGYYNQSVNAIDSETNAAKEKYESDKVNAQKAAEEHSKAVEAAYAKAKEDTSNDALKRGLARSSIAVNKMSGLESEKAGVTAKAAADLAEKITSLDTEISSLSVKREKALNDFNITYASKLTTQINALKSEREQKQTEALKYNNSLAQKEYEESVNKTMKESELYSEKLSQKEKEQKLKVENEDEIQKQMYEKMRGVLASQPTSQAYKLLQEDPIYRDNLNDYYYYRLYNEFAR